MFNNVQKLLLWHLNKLRLSLAANIEQQKSVSSHLQTLLTGLVVPTLAWSEVVQLSVTMEDSGRGRHDLTASRLRRRCLDQGRILSIIRN